MLRLIGLAALFGLAAPVARAQIVNGGFETGNLTGWNASGTNSAVGTQFSLSPDAGSFQAYGLGGTTTRPNLEAFFNLPANSLNTQLGVTCWGGSGISQLVSVNAGDTLTFRFNFHSGEGQNSSGWNDCIFRVIDGNVVELADTYTPLDGNANSGYQTSTYTFPAAGNFLVGVGTINVNDNAVPSAFLVDSFAITPEPSALLLLGLAPLIWRRLKAA